jgi:hypothetical protein
MWQILVASNGTTVGVKETDVHSAIGDYLALRKVFFHRQNHIAVRFIDSAGSRQFRRLPKHTPSGIPDILAIKDGRAIFLEVKAEKGKQSDAQKEFERNAVTAGAQYAIVRSIEDVQAIGL